MAQIVYRWVGTPGESLLGVPCQDLSDGDLRQLATTRGWTLWQLCAMLDGSPLFRRVGTYATLATVTAMGPSRPRNK